MTIENSRLSEARLAVRQATHANENDLATSMLAGFPLNKAARDEIVQTAHAIVTRSREMSAERGTLDAFMQEFGLSNQEGVALMCLAEALLRIPNAETQQTLLSPDNLTSKFVVPDSRNNDQTNRRYCRRLQRSQRRSERCYSSQQIPAKFKYQHDFGLEPV